MLLDIVVLPPKELSSAIARAARGLKKEFSFDYLVDDKHLLPHISLYHLQIQAKDLPVVIRVLKELARTQNKITVQLGTVEAKRTIFAYPLLKSKQWQKLHEVVVRNLMDLRNGVMRAAFNFPPGSEDVVKKYGSPFVMELNWPHITLGRTTSADDIPSVLKIVPKAKPFKFDVTEIAIAEVNTEWQVKRIIKKIQLHETRNTSKKLRRTGSR